MPNWCDNSITIESTKEIIAEMMQAIEAKQFLQYLRPMPKELENTVADGKSAMDWYTWRVENWSTKWEVDAEIASSTDTSIQMYFQSAWGPPINAYDHFHDAMIEKDIPIDIQADYIEWGMMFCGFWENGEETHYSIPETEELAKEMIPEETLDHFGILEEIDSWEELEMDHADDV
jgi:hypothetical protein|tara:strand:- start:1758 stop:2285 length:528 start_codon:yes stop_codon:yes gene_type:complete